MSQAKHKEIDSKIDKLNAELGMLGQRCADPKKKASVRKEIRLYNEMKNLLNGTKLKLQLLKPDDKIELESGEQFKILRIWEDLTVDMEALKPLSNVKPVFYPIYFCIKLENFKVL